MKEQHDWDKVLEWETRLDQGEALVLTPDVADLIRRVAREVALSEQEAQRALVTPADAAMLIRGICRRIREGSRRLMGAISEANRRMEAGDTAGARKILEDVLSVESVPLYRQHAEAELSYLE
ncbi:DUSAM domain-containing protein [Stigmatella sp. ncwal1]|uniref:DUSAM domain-containing protein n=1 Tax=Stigmatella ashevillensis TaxID=2995309 RepID=A0ABT5DE83_9BACT|nr:DUSAM domain-containing protein [Stigmatella ashevillena]MDC0711990.1 DUSAM domain-containing protein [Stigmatella ashevillena]